MRTSTFCGFSIKPLKVKLLAGEQNATEICFTLLLSDVKDPLVKELLFGCILEGALLNGLLQVNSHDDFGGLEVRIPHIEKPSKVTIF